MTKFLHQNFNDKNYALFPFWTCKQRWLFYKNSILVSDVLQVSWGNGTAPNKPYKGG